MPDDLRYPRLETGTGGDVGNAQAFTEEGGAAYGHLAVDTEGRVVFVEDFPDHDPKEE